ncbi:hypothetical protein GOM71_15820 [Paenibacillus sp. NEAU-GSW1]|nr:hypothetical protein [Paenibacillus sp. NEAU-GSW1]
MGLFTIAASGHWLYAARWRADYIQRVFPYL